MRSNMLCYEDNLKGNAGFYNGMERDIANHNHGWEQSVLEPNWTELNRTEPNWKPNKKQKREKKENYLGFGVDASNPFQVG